MSYSFPRIQLLPTEFPQLLKVQNQSPLPEYPYNYGNSLMAVPSLRNASPASSPLPHQRYPSLEMSPPRNPGSPNYYGSRDPNMSPNQGSPNYDGYRQGPDVSPKRPPPRELLALQTYNTLSTRINQTNQAREALKNQIAASIPTPTPPQNASPAPALEQDSIIEKPPNPVSVIPVIPVQAGPNQQLYYVQPTYLRGSPINRLEEGQEFQNMSPAVSGFFDKQSQVMARILKDVEVYKRMEYTRQRMILDQQFGLVDGSLDGLVNPYQSVPLLYSRSQVPTPSDQIRLKHPSIVLVPTAREPDSNHQTPTPPKKELSTITEKNEKESAAGKRNDKNDKKEGTGGKGNDKIDKKESIAQAGKPVKKPVAKKAAKSKARSNIRKIGWTMALPGLWFISAVKWADQRRERELKALEDLIPEHLEKFLEFASGVLDKEIHDLVTDKSSMILVPSPGTTIKPADITKRCKTITDHLVTMLDTLSLKLDSGKLDKHFFEFLAGLSENDAVLPDNFLSGFEIDRLSFNMFANLTSMDEWRSKMILGTFIIIKGLLYFLIMRSWTVISSIPEKDVNMKNMINIGSALYHIVIDVLAENVPENGLGGPNPPFKAVPPSFAAVEPAMKSKLGVVPDENDDDEQEIISGFYNRDRLKPYLDNKPQLVREVKDAIIDFLDVLYELTHSHYEPKTHVKNLFAEHRPK